MIVYPKRRALVLRLREPERVTNIIPTAKLLSYKGQTLVAVPHRLDECKVLRNLGINAPSPTRYYYDWPRGFQEPPFEAQYGTVDALTFYRNLFVLNDLGTGKTLAALWAFDYLRHLGELHKMLVVAPLSTLDRVWADAVFMNFPHLSYAVLHGTRERRFKLLDQDADVYIINHDGIKTRGFLDALAKRPDIDVIVPDEGAQLARTAGTDRWRTLNKICKQHSRRVWWMTGTPTPNGPTDAWAQCRIVSPANVPQYFNKFKDLVMRQVGPFTWIPRDNAVELVHQVMAPAVRYTRDECVDLPPCVYQTRSVELTSEQKVAYKDMLNKLRAELESGEVLAVNEAVKVSKLVQIACGIAYGPNGEENVIPCENRHKVVKEIIEEAGTKVIVFVPFVAAVKQVAAYLAQHFSVEMVYGDVSKNERDRIFEVFQKNTDPRVLVAQPSVMSHGLTLTAANTIVWYAPINSNETYEQANGRITRPGQKQTQFIINIEGTGAERKIYERLKKKQAMQSLLLELVKEVVY